MKVTKDKLIVTFAIAVTIALCGAGIIIYELTQDIDSLRMEIGNILIDLYKDDCPEIQIEPPEVMMKDD